MAIPTAAKSLLMTMVYGAIALAILGAVFRSGSAHLILIAIAGIAWFFFIR